MDRLKSSDFELNSEIFNQIITCLTLENILSKTWVKRNVVKGANVWGT